MAAIQARLRLATVEGRAVSGYRSGRKRWRDTPDTDSTDNVLSAGTRPLEIQLDTVLCAPKPRRRASAVCPPTDLHASSSAARGVSSVVSVMTPINAQTVEYVNAESGNARTQTMRMGRKSESEPSAFWRRLIDAWSEQDLPTSQNGVATKLKMSQGSVGRWFHGEGLPELETCIDIAGRGRVCVEWLITGNLPKYPISRDAVLREIFETCVSLDDAGRAIVLRAAKGELLQKQAEEIAAAPAKHKRA